MSAETGSSPAVATVPGTGDLHQCAARRNLCGGLPRRAPALEGACLKTHGLCRDAIRRFEPNGSLPLSSFDFRREPADSDNASKA